MKREIRVCKMLIAERGKNVWIAAVLEQLILWQDIVPRDGPENMAIDEWLWLHGPGPVLRVYQWQSSWMSLGYFSQSDDVPAGRKFVRRPTGGGVVLHGEDWAYTLMVPRGEALADMPGAESYRVIHQCLMHVLREEGVDCHLLERASGSHSHFCFVNAVVHDLIDAEGAKLAGAGQRRGKTGLLHQGSVQVSGSGENQRAMRFAQQFCRAVHDEPPCIDWDWVVQRASDLYATAAWNQKK
jgi:lipoate-protein ligase A